MGVLKEEGQGGAEGRRCRWELPDRRHVTVTPPASNPNQRGNRKIPRIFITCDAFRLSSGCPMVSAPRVLPSTYKTTPPEVWPPTNHTTTPTFFVPRNFIIQWNDFFLVAFRLCRNVDPSSGQVPATRSPYRELDPWLAPLENVSELGSGRHRVSDNRMIGITGAVAITWGGGGGMSRDR